MYLHERVTSPSPPSSLLQKNDTYLEYRVTTYTCIGSTFCPVQTRFNMLRSIGYMLRSHLFILSNFEYLHMYNRENTQVTLFSLFNLCELS